MHLFIYLEKFKIFYVRGDRSTTPTLCVIQSDVKKLTYQFPTVCQIKIMKYSMKIDTLPIITYYQWWYWHIVWHSPSRKYQYFQTRTRTVWRCLDWSGCMRWYWTLWTYTLIEKPRSGYVSGPILLNSSHWPFEHTTWWSEMKTSNF